MKGDAKNFRDIGCAAFFFGALILFVILFVLPLLSKLLGWVKGVL